jgi:hypothetical protein
MRLYYHYFGGPLTDESFSGDSTFYKKLHFKLNEVNTKKYDSDFVSHIDIWLDSAGGALKVRYKEVNQKRDYEDFYLHGTISAFFGNCGICSISAPEVRDDDGLGEKFFQFLLDLCHQMKYTQVLYSVYDKQTETINIITKNGFKPFEESTIENKRSNNTIQIYYLNIN